MSATAGRPYGIAARFEDAATLTAALRRLRDAGYVRLEAYAPRPLEEAHAILPPHRSPIPGIMLAGGALGLAAAFLLQVWAAFDYPIEVAGRPLFSWPAFVPVCFELTVLSASFCGIGAWLWLTGLPRLDHPLFARSDFVRASQDAYFVCVRGDDPRYDAAAIGRLLHAGQAAQIEEVAP